MSARYTATFDSLRPQRGVVLDEEAERFAYFPSLAHAERIAVKLNSGETTLMGPSLADVLNWRSTSTGKPLDPNPPDSGTRPDA